MASTLHRRVSLHFSSIDAGMTDLIPLLEGHLDRLPPLSARVVRVFISSTFSDMIQERNALMENVYPKLKDFCREKYRLEFQMIDLRWGLREESQDDHTIVEFLMREIDNCLRMSVGPSFVILLGQKYGYRAFPSKINADTFEMLRSELVSKGKDVTLLGQWYRKDTNRIPNVYSLQPISTFIPDYTKTVSADRELHQKAIQEWERIFQELQHILRMGVMFCWEQNKLSQQDKDVFFISVTECEIKRHMSRSPAPHNTSLYFTRHITNLEENISCKRAAKFIDLVTDQQTAGVVTIDKDAQQMLNSLRNNKVPESLRKAGGMPIMKQFEVTWKDPEESNPNEDPVYLSQFGDAFEEQMKALVVRGVESVRPVSRSSQASEIHQHLTMCRTRSQMFKGRDDILSKMRCYLISPANYPLVIYGLSGSGKTSLLAKCASLIRSWFNAPGLNDSFNSMTLSPTGSVKTACVMNRTSTCSSSSSSSSSSTSLSKPPALIIRFLGTTALCCSIRLVLGSICWQIVSLRGADTSSIPGDYPSLVNYFHSLLKETSPHQPLVLILDSLDQLSPAHRAHNLSWLPRVLPPHVHIILSTLPYEYDLLETLRVLILDQDCFIQICPLGQQLSIGLVKEWLTGSRRDLTEFQAEVVTDALSRCSLPLYTRLVFEEVSRWSSYAPPEQTQLEFTVKGIINKLLERLEKYQGHIFVKHALSYLTASKNGLSDCEMEDVLSLDETVLNDVFQHWLPPIRRIPPLLLPRLRDELSSYIMQREANGSVVYYWYHHQFIFVAKERYLYDEVHKIYIHGMLAHYFLGTWGGGKKKAFQYSPKQIQLMSTRRRDTEQADRKVPLQPLEFGPDPLDPNVINYNLRKLSELPYHLLESRLIVDLKKEVLLNYSFLHAKLSAMSLHDILSDFRCAIESSLHDPEVQLVFSALRVGGTYVNKNPDTLAFDLLGRLLVYYNDKLSIRELLQQCDSKSRPHSALLPLFQCFESPRAMLLYMLEDHAQVVIDLVFTKHDLVSIARDGSIVFWDLSTGECTLSIRIPMENSTFLGQNTKLYATDDNKYLIVDSDVINSPVFIYDMKTAALLHQCGRRSPNQKRGFLVGNLLCRQKNIIDVQRGEIVMTLDKFVVSKRYLSCAITPDQKHILIGEDLVTKMFVISDGRLIATFPAENSPALFHITEDCLRAYVGYTEDCLFKVFNIDTNSRSFGEVTLTFNYKLCAGGSKMLDGQRHYRELAEIAVSPINEDLVVLNIRRCNLVRFNVKTGESKLLDMKAINASNKTTLVNISFSFNGKFILAGQENLLYIWDTVTANFLSSIYLHSTAGFPFAVSRTQNLIACGSTIHTAIKVWDLSKMHIKDAMDVMVYESPLDAIVTIPAMRLAFIKKYYALSTNKGYQYVDSFGIDIWNISTGTCQPFLPFSRYGKLLQMEVSPDGHQMALLLSARDTYVSMINTKTAKISRNIEISNCYAISVSIRWDFLVTCSTGDSVKEIVLWNIRTGSQVVRFKQATSPVFTLDAKFLLYIDSGQTLITYCLVKMAPVRYMAVRADHLTPLPVKHRLVLTSRNLRSQSPGYSPGRINKTGLGGDGLSPDHRRDSNGDDGSVEVSVWDFHESRRISRFYDVASSGIKDISKDGELAVDARLQVFSVMTGQIVKQLADTSFDSSDDDDEDNPSNGGRTGWNQSTPARECLFVRFTYDGLHVIYVDELSVKVKAVSTGRIIAHTSTHERITSLQTMDYGYVIILGREDGRLLVMKLVSESRNIGYRPDSVGDRINFLLEDFSSAQMERVASFDLYYQAPPRCTKDADIPRASDSIKTALANRAKVPHAVITTPKVPPATAAVMAPGADMPLCRRSQSQSALGGGVEENGVGRDDSPISQQKYMLQMIDVSGGSGIAMTGGSWASQERLQTRKSSSEQSPLSLNSTPTTPSEFPTAGPPSFSPTGYGPPGAATAPVIQSGATPSLTPFTSRITINPLHLATLPHLESSPYARRSRLGSSHPSISNVSSVGNQSADVSADSDNVLGATSLDVDTSLSPFSPNPPSMLTGVPALSSCPEFTKQRRSSSIPNIFAMPWSNRNKGSSDCLSGSSQSQSGNTSMEETARPSSAATTSRRPPRSSLGAAGGGHMLKAMLDLITPHKSSGTISGKKNKKPPKAPVLPPAASKTKTLPRGAKISQVDVGSGVEDNRDRMPSV